MEKKIEKVNEIREYCKSIATAMGEMFIGYDEWSDIEDDAEIIDGEIYLLKKRNGERVYQVVGRQCEKYDRVDDFNDKCVEIFEYNNHDVITLQNVYDKCFDHRYEEALYRKDFEMIKDLTEDFKRCENYIDEYFTSNDYFLTISEYLSPDVVERYPMVWFEDVWEYRIALKLPNMQWVTRDRKHGNIIECFDGKEDAEQAIILYEKEDKEDGVYEDDFYEVAYVDA